MVYESFTFSVLYKGQERNFDAALQQYGYSYRITITIDGVDIFFEPDEERNYRAILPDAAGNKKEIDPKLLQVIATRLEEIFK